MASRYSLAKPREVLSNRYGVPVPESWKPRYNVAPGQEMPVITNRRKDELSFFKWGFVPNWSLDDSSATNLFNAKAENILTKAPFKQAARTQRCIVLADGYFEWKKTGKNKLPYRITLVTDEVFAFAGLWDYWENPNDGKIINTYTIITVPANRLLQELNDRMPVILTQETEQMWLSDKLPESAYNEILKPYNPDKMSFYQAHRVVNSTAYDYPECIQPAPKIYPGETYSLFD
ncbi:MAG: SOS response-associated peptidase [Cytophagaceae bacterium]|nr:SOS response-associated peptidase [Cytophagaceae bacterium]MDW8456600.1 SOS response-associated peptidase [Cytophagaceae bacterium]